MNDLKREIPSQRDRDGILFGGDGCISGLRKFAGEIDKVITLLSIVICADDFKECLVYERELIWLKCY